MSLWGFSKNVIGSSVFGIYPLAIGEPSVAYLESSLTNVGNGLSIYLI